MASNSKRNVIIDSLFWKFFERVFAQIISLVVQIILARILYPSDFGSLAILLAIINFMSIFVQSGLSTTIIQKSEIEDDDISTLYTSSLFVALILYLLLFTISPWISSFFNVELTWPLRVLSLSLFFHSVNSIQIAILSREMDFRTIFLRTAISAPIAGVIGVCLAYVGFGIWALVSYNLISIIALVCVMFVTANYKLRLGFSWKRAKILYPFTLKIIGTNLVSGFGDSMRTMLIGKYYTTSQLAYYDKAYTYSNYVTQTVGATIQSVMLPALSQEQHNITSLKEMARKSVSITGFLLIPILSAVAVCAKPLVILLLTEKWSPSIPYFVLFCLFRISGCLTTIDKQVFYALGKSGIGLYYEIVMIICNIISLIITLPMGMWAVAVGATIVEFLGCFLLFTIGYSIYGYSLKERFKDLIKPIINSVFMIVSMLSITMLGMNMYFTLLLEIIVGIVVYILCSYVVKDKSLHYIINVIKEH